MYIGVTILIENTYKLKIFEVIVVDTHNRELQSKILQQPKGQIPDDLTKQYTYERKFMSGHQFDLGNVRLNIDIP